MTPEEAYQKILLSYGGLFAQELRKQLELTDWKYAYGFNGDAYGAPPPDGRNPKYKGEGDKIGTGKLRDSITASLNTSTNSIIIEMLSYWRSVNDGREEGKYVPIKPLEEWAERKGFSNPRSAAFGISTNIKKFGIEPTYFYDKAFTEFEQKYAQEIEEKLFLAIEDFFNKITEVSIK